MRAFIAAMLATTLVASSAFAATVAPLAPGKPAGVKNAALEGSDVMWGTVIVAVGAGLGLALSGNGDGGSSNSTTITSGTTTTTTTTTGTR